MDRFVAYAVLCRAVLLGRCAVVLAAVGVSIRLVEDQQRPIATVIAVALTTAVEVAVISRWPGVVRWRLCALAVDAVLLLGLMVQSGASVAFFCYAAGSAALAGALLGISALPLWIANAALGLAGAVALLRTAGPGAARSSLAPFVVAFPMTDIVCGLGAAVLTTALARYIDVSIEAMAAAQRSAAASERARLARELHDSVAKTLRGVSFAALALPSSLRRHPAMAEQLAATVQEGADTAVREARELLAALRRDVPDQPFVDTIDSVCGTWAGSTGILVGVRASAIEPSLAARYELTQILHEALRNVAQHSHATHVEVSLRLMERHVELTVRDNGSGFVVPPDLSTLSAAGNFGILGMSERARAIGGTLHVRARPGGGTSVTARVPVAAVDSVRVAIP